MFAFFSTLVIICASFATGTPLNGARPGGSGAPLGVAPVVFYNSTALHSRMYDHRRVILLQEGFESIVPVDWVVVQRSDPVGVTSVFQGNTGVFNAQAGTDSSYAGMNFNSAGNSPGTISTWLLTPQIAAFGDTVVKFWTRTATGSTFPDRLEVRLSMNGASTNVGATATSTGDFTTQLLVINPSLITGGYPEDWMEFTLNIAGGFDGRIGFWYTVSGGGPVGTNSNYIGIDTFSMTNSATIATE